MNELMSNLQEALNAAGVDYNLENAKTAEQIAEAEANFIDEIVPLQSLAKETQFSGK